MLSLYPTAPQQGREVAACAPHSTVDPYLLGRITDAFCFGPGATILVASVVLGLQRLGPSATAAAGALTLWLAWIFVGPHYAATYRRAYTSLTVVRAHPWVTLAAPPLLLLAAVAAVRVPRTLGLAYFAAYVGWSGYHYSGQSLGLAMVYPLRQGAPLAATERRLLAIPLYVSWILSVLGLFRASEPTRNPAYLAVQRAYPGPPLPSWVPLIGLGVLAVSLVGVAVLARRRSRDGVPLPRQTHAVIATQVLWFTIGLYQPFFNIVLVPIFHSLQYLAFTSWHACRARTATATRWLRVAFYLGPTLLLGVAIFPGSFWFLSRVRVAADPFVMTAAVASFLNLHHFLLDGRIWRMRERPVVQSMIG